MRRLILVSLLVLGVSAPLAGTAGAVCDPDYRPLCLSPCVTGIPESLVRGELPEPQACPR